MTKLFKKLFIIVTIFACLLLVGCKRNEDEPTPEPPVEIKGTITLQADKLQGYVGDTITVNVNVASEQFNFDQVDFKVSGSAVELKVDTTNKKITLELKSAGEATLTATVKLNTEIKAELKVTVVEVPAPTITNASAPKEAYFVGEEEQLSVTVSSVKDYTLEWASSDTSVVEVTADGKVTAKGVGSANVTVTVKDTNVSHTFAFVVVTPITAITVEYEATMDLLTSQDLVIKTTPSENVLKDFEVVSSNPNVITVNGDNGLDAFGAGTVTITVTAKDGGNASFEFKVTVVDPAGSNDVTVCDPNVATMLDGATYEYLGNEYTVGLTAFSVLADAIEAASTKTYVAAGEYGGFTLDKENFELIGPNAGKDPSGARLTPAVITGTISIASTAKNVTINGFDFTGEGTVVSENSVHGITLCYNSAYSTNLVAASNWTHERYKIKEAIFYLVASDNALDICIYDINIHHNKFESVSETNVMVARCVNVSITDNVFHNFGMDAVRSEGGYNRGLWTIENNKFENDTLSGMNGVYLQATSGEVDGVSQEITVRNNTFKNIGNASDTTGFSGAFIAGQMYQEKGLKLTVEFNIFENCVNYIVSRNNGAKKDNYTEIINYNKFVGVPSAAYHRNKTPNSGDNDSSNPPLAVMDYNLFLDNEDNVIATLDATKFLDIDESSNKNNFATKEAYEAQIKKLLGLDFDMVVSSSWDKLAEGASVEVEGLTFVIGTNAFATIGDALDHTDGNVTIKVLAGNYNEEGLRISHNGIKLVGPNAGVNARYVNRATEAVIEQEFLVNASVTDFTVDGFELTAAAGIDLEHDAANITLQYCVINGTAKDGIVRSPMEDGIYVYNIKMVGNYSTNYKGWRFAHLTNVSGLNMSNNYIESTGAMYDFLNSQGIVEGEVVIKDNVCKNTAQSFLYVKGVKQINALIEGNYVENIASTIVDFRDMKDSSAAAVFNILNNTFVDSGCGWRPIRIRTAGYGDGNSITINVHYNKFIDSYCNDTCYNPDDSTLKYNLFVENPSWKTTPEKFKKIYNLDNNYFEIDGVAVTELTDANFDYAALSWANPYANKDDMPVYVVEDMTAPTGVSITNKIAKLGAYETHQMEFSITPSDATNKKLGFLSSDTSIATVSSAGLITGKKEGKVTITVYAVADDSVRDSMEVEITAVERIELRYEGNAVLVKGGKVDITSTYHGDGHASDTLHFTSSDPTIATVDDSGQVTALKAGLVTITATLGDLTAEVGFTVVDEELTGLLGVLVAGNNGVIINKDIKYIGSDDGSADYWHNIYGSANDYFAGTVPAVTNNPIDTSLEKASRRMKSVEFIVFHDTGASPSSSTARANSNWCNNPSSEVSWHYTIGNDGIYKQMEDNIMGWHAGDGLSWGESTTWYDTGIAYAGERPKVTTNSDGYFYINGQKTLVKMPSGATASTPINRLGLVVAKGANGNYMLPTTWISSGYGNPICARGGGLNGIGIESAVNMGSDVYLTWQYSAKHIATLLINNNLTPDRVWFHNNFSNKTCPNTMINSDMVSTFLELVYCEYEVAKNYANYTIKFESSNTNILDNGGRVKNAPNYTTNVTYKVTVTDGSGNSESITLNALVPGKYNH